MFIFFFFTFKETPVTIFTGFFDVFVVFLAGVAFGPLKEVAN